MTTMLPISQLQPNPFQPRAQLLKEDLEELTQSIKTYGILEPIVVAHTPAGYQIIAGERRWRAAQAAGLDEVPVHVKKTTPKGMLEMALVENVQRVDLSALERAQAFRELMRSFGHTTSELAIKVGKSPSYISNTLRLLELPDAITDGLVSGLISEGHARALSGIPTESEMVQAYKIVIKQNLSVRGAEELARRFKERLNSGQINDKGRPLTINNHDVEKWESSFKRLFRTPTQFKLTRSQRQTKVTITLKGSPQETEADLEKMLSLVESE